MGSQAIQSKLWGQRSKDWAEIQESTGLAGYDFVLSAGVIHPGTKLLDVGCGSGYFCKKANNAGAIVKGLDATPELIEEAKKRLPTVSFVVGEMEELPFEDSSLDVVTGFNSFQYAADTTKALTEAKRVLVNNGKLAVMIWGTKENCEAASFLKAVGSLLPPPPPGAPGPFALSENQLLENILQSIHFTIISNNDIESVWDYPDTETALKGLMSAGPAARAIDASGFDKTYETVLQAIQPYIKPDGRVVYHNSFRVVICEKRN